MAVVIVAGEDERERERRRREEGEERAADSRLAVLALRDMHAPSRPLNASTSKLRFLSSSPHRHNASETNYRCRFCSETPLLLPPTCPALFHRPNLRPVRPARSVLASSLRCSPGSPQCPPRSRCRHPRFHSPTNCVPRLYKEAQFDVEIRRSYSTLRVYRPAMRCRVAGLWVRREVAG